MKNLKSEKYFWFFTRPRQTNRSDYWKQYFGIQRNGIDLPKCRVQTFDGASAICREALRAASLIEKVQFSRIHALSKPCIILNNQYVCKIIS